MGIQNYELVNLAVERLRPKEIGTIEVADTGCALLGADGQVYTGANIGGPLGICAEQSALSSMLSKAGPRVKKIASVWKDKHGDMYIVPPCEKCRKLLGTLSNENQQTEILLGKEQCIKLKDILPYHTYYSEKL